MNQPTTHPYREAHKVLVLKRPAPASGLLATRAGLLHPFRQHTMPCLAIEVGLGDAQPLGRQLVVAGIERSQQRVNARQEQAGVDRRLDRLERAAAGRQKQRAWQETERNRA